MTGKLLHELRQTRPFGSLEQEAYLGVLRTAAVLEHAVAEALRPHGITATQYNVLRILRGAGPEGLCRNEVRDRMIARVPDATRLLDRMEALGLVERERGTEDRRYVSTRISRAGVRLLGELDEPVQALHRAHFGHLAEAELQALIGALDRVRDRL